MSRKNLFNILPFLIILNSQATDQMDVDSLHGELAARGEKRAFTPEVSTLIDLINENLEGDDPMDTLIDNPAKRLLDENRMTDVRNDFELQELNRLYMSRALEGSFKEICFLSEKSEIDHFTVIPGDIVHPLFEHYYNANVWGLAQNWLKDYPFDILEEYNVDFKLCNNHNKDVTKEGIFNGTFYLVRRIDVIEFCAQTYLYPQALTVIGKYHRDKGHFDLAANYFDQAVAQGYRPAHVEKTLQEGLQAVQLGNMDLAKDHFNAVVFLTKNNYSKDSDGKWVFTVAVEEDPRDPNVAIYDRLFTGKKAAFELGKIYLNEGNFKNAYHAVVNNDHNGSFLSPQGAWEFEKSLKKQAQENPSLLD